MKDQKVSTTVGTVILIIIAATVTGFVLLCFKNYPVEDNVKSIIFSEQKMDTSNWKMYSNEEYGFKVKLPGDIDKWNIHVEESNNNVQYKTKTFTAWFNYPLDQKILSVESQPELGYVTDMDIYYIVIIPINDYVNNACKKTPYPLCRQGEVIGQNDKYVFVSGFGSIEGAGYLCLDQYEKLKEFCDVDSVITDITSEFKAF